MSGHLAILGGGQLGRLLALSALQLGVRVRVLDPDAAAPAAEVAPTRCAAWDDEEALAWLADGAAAMTWEREDVPLETLRALARRAPVRPGPGVLLAVEDRAAQKALLRRVGLATAPWAVVAPGAEPDGRALAVGLPAVVKARRGGFDGRGQRVVHDVAALRAACAEFSAQGSIVEAFVAFDDELAVLAARSVAGDIRTWDPVRTCQVDGRLAWAVAPHLAAGRLGDAPRETAATLLEALGHVGVLAVECFRLGDRLVVNEIAPRVHNSGHWTPEGSRCGQFEQHVRAVLGLPLGDTRTHGAAGLVNCVGRLPERSAVLAVPGAALTVYGKRPRPGRKLGHVTVVAADHAALRRPLAEAVAACSPPEASLALAGTLDRPARRARRLTDHAPPPRAPDAPAASAATAGCAMRRSGEIA